ncbi:unnamed protein product [Ceratitis capitata]|uniref:(Mediterranean fruit fly) hypothetical protein n=1 Tax=Ceratitis capitata TaxID=7213 RepID=A0A811VGT6_CERCA|nr:unnamed protein product [Ceratitis capitata]
MVTPTTKYFEVKNHMLPAGELLVYNITRTDAHKVYRCRTHYKLTQDSVVSSKIQLTQMRGGASVVVPCVAYVNPKPVYRWHTKRPNNEESIQHLLATGRAKLDLQHFGLSKTNYYMAEGWSTITFRCMRSFTFYRAYTHYVNYE